MPPAEPFSSEPEDHGHRGLRRGGQIVQGRQVEASADEGLESAGLRVGQSQIGLGDVSRVDVVFRTGQVQLAEPAGGVGDMVRQDDEVPAGSG